MQIHVHRFVLNCIDMPRCYLMQIPGYIKIYYFYRKYMACGMTSFQCCKKKKLPNANIFVCPNVCCSFLFLETFFADRCVSFIWNIISHCGLNFLSLSLNVCRWMFFLITYFIRFIILVTSTGNCAFHTSFSFQEIYQSHKSII